MAMNGMNEEDACPPRPQALAPGSSTSSGGSDKPMAPSMTKPHSHQIADSSPQIPGSDGQSGISLGRGMACGFCRRRKLRCSGERPICSNCNKYTKHCEYGPAPKIAKVQALESKIAQLSSLISQNNIPGSEPPPIPPTFNSRAVSEAGPSSSTSMSGAPSSGTSMSGAQSVHFNQYRDASSGGMINGYDSNSFASSSVLNAEDYLDFSGHDSQETDFGQTGQYGNLEGFAPSVQDFASWVPPDLSPYTMFPNNLFSNPPETIFPSMEAYEPRLQADLKPDLASPFINLPSYLSMNVNGDCEPGNSTMPFQPQTNYPSQIPFPCDNWQSPTMVASSNRSTLVDHSPAPPTGHATEGRVSVTQDFPASAIFSDTITHTAHIDPIDGLTERLGEFLFNPTEGAAKAEDGWAKKRKGIKGKVQADAMADDGQSWWIVRNNLESDGLTDSTRNLLIDCFLAHSKLFFEMSIPRFRYRLTFNDRRRPSLALLNAMYLWATRMSNSPQMSSMEHTFFVAACRQLDLSSANGDRLIDCLRTAMLLSAYSYTSGRFHEGWILAGMAVRLVMSTGLHQIKSCIFRPESPKNVFLRNRVYLLPPPEDAVELAERIHTFWCVFSIDRCGALATGFPAGLAEQDVTTPFPRPLADISSGSVTSNDDITVGDLYRLGYRHPVQDTPHALWVKAITILERSLKLAFIEPEDSSEFARAWSHYHITSPADPRKQKPPAWLDQPKYRCPKDYSETKLGLDQLMAGMGVEGIFPVDRKRNAELDRVPMPFISPHTVMMHHQFAVITMLIHDVNSLDAENKEALIGARRSVAMMRLLPQMPIPDVDSFCVVVWSMIAKGLIKEMHRLRLVGDIKGSMTVEQEVDTVISEMHRIGAVMQLARTQAKAMNELKRLSVSPQDNLAPAELYHTSSDYRSL